MNDLTGGWGSAGGVQTGALRIYKILATSSNSWQTLLMIQTVHPLWIGPSCYALRDQLHHNSHYLFVYRTGWDWRGRSQIIWTLRQWHRYCKLFSPDMNVCNFWYMFQVACFGFTASPHFRNFGVFLVFISYPIVNYTHSYKFSTLINETSCVTTDINLSWFVQVSRTSCAVVLLQFWVHAADDILYVCTAKFRVKPQIWHWVEPESVRY